MRLSFLTNLFKDNCAREFHDLLSPYLDNELASTTKTRLEKHLGECPECRALFEEISFASGFAAKFEMPEKVATGFPVWLKNAKLEEPSPVKSKSRWRMPMLAAASLAIILFGIIGLRFYYRTSPGQPWEVTNLVGATRVGSKIISKTGLLNEGDWLETNRESRALINISNIGYLEVEADSRLQLVRSRSGEKRLELKKGRINASIVAPPRLFFVETPAATAIDYGCAYSLDVAESGESRLQVTEGWVKLEANGKGVMIPAGAIARAVPEKGTGTPYFEDATENFRRALYRVDFENNSPTDINIVVAESRLRDSLTLWYLLKRTQNEMREQVFNRLAEFVPPPPGVSREYLLNHLDAPEIEESWREKIEYVSIGIDPANLPPVGTLRPTGTMKTARFAHTATLMTDGQVLIAGGLENENTALSSAEIYNPPTGEFQSTGQLSIQRVGHTATALRDGRVLMTGGSETSFFRGATASAEIYDPTTKTFNPITPMSTPRLAHRATLLPDGRVLITGGQDTDRKKLATAEIFDPQTNAFSQLPAMRNPRSDHTATLLNNGFVFIAGGAAGYEDGREMPSASSEIFNPKTNKFTPASEMSVPRFKHSSTLLPDGRVLITGGADARMGGGKYRSAEIFDPVSGKFSSTGDLKTARYKIRDSVVPLSNGKILVAGGGGRLEVFDPKTGFFSLVAGGTNTARYYATATLLPNGEVLIVGGYLGNQLPEFNPDTSAWIFKP